MNLGNSLCSARKKADLSQEEAAEKLGVSRQTISKWETNETLPDIRQSKRLAVLYRVSLDELIEFDIDVKEIEQIIEKTSEETQKKIDWTRMWSKKYPVLAKYSERVQVEEYASALRDLLERLKRDYGYNELDAFLVLKDILGKLYQAK